MSATNLHEFVEAFIRHIRPVLSENSLRQKKWQAGAFAAWVEKQNKEITALTTADIEAYLATKSRCNATTRRDYLATIRDFYGFLCDSRPRQSLCANPAAAITFKRSVRRRVVLVPGPEQIRAILGRFAERGDILSVRNRAMAELAYGSGLRLGELVALDAEDIDFEKRQAYVKGKGGHTRMAPVTGAALTALRTYLDRRGASEGPLFIGRRRTRLRPVTVGWLFRKKVGIRAHLLRHACATHMLLNGCDIRFIQEILGHKYLTTTQVYTHIIPVDVERVVKTLHPRASTKKND